MDSFSWKRNLFPTYYRPSALKDGRGSHVVRVVPEKLLPTKESSSAVVSEQTPEDDDGNGKKKSKTFRT